jgi:hypothetical protein
MPTRIAVAISILFFAGSGAKAADCAPNCDYYHDYGPYDFSWVRPGLTGYPVCDSHGNCSPYLVYRQSGRRFGQVTVRPTPKRRGPYPAR